MLIRSIDLGELCGLFPSGHLYSFCYVQVLYTDITVNNRCYPQTILILEPWSNDLDSARCTINFFGMICCQVSEFSLEVSRKILQSGCTSSPVSIISGSSSLDALPKGIIQAGYFTGQLSEAIQRIIIHKDLHLADSKALYRAASHRYHMLQRYTETQVPISRQVPGQPTSDARHRSPSVEPCAAPEFSGRFRVLDQLAMDQRT